MERNNRNEATVEAGNEFAHGGNALSDTLLCDPDIGRLTLDPLRYHDWYGVPYTAILECGEGRILDLVKWRGGMQEYHRQNRLLGSFHNTKFSKDWDLLFDKLEAIDTWAGRTDYLFEHDKDYQSLKEEYESAKLKHKEHLRTIGFRTSSTHLPLAHHPASPAHNYSARAASLDTSRPSSATLKAAATISSSGGLLKQMFQGARKTKHRFFGSSTQK